MCSFMCVLSNFEQLITALRSNHQMNALTEYTVSRPTAWNVRVNLRQLHYFSDIMGEFHALKIVL